MTNLKYLKTLFPRILSHFMSGPKGNNEFCFTETSMLPKAKLIITLRIVIHKIIRPLRSAYISTTLKLPSLYLIFQGSQAFKSFQNPSANLKYFVTDNAGERDLPVSSAYGSRRVGGEVRGVRSNPLWRSIIIGSLSKPRQQQQQQQQ